MSSRGRTGGESRSRAGGSAATAVASLHEASRAWQAAHPGAPKEAQPGGAMPAPIRTPGATKIHALAVIESRDLVNTYGEENLGAVLSHVSQGLLRETARLEGVQAGRTNAETISRITAAATNGHYSADFAKTAAATKAATTGNRTVAQHEARIAKLRDQLAKAEAAYAAYKAAPPKTGGGARGTTAAKVAGPKPQLVTGQPRTTVEINTNAQRMSDLRQLYPSDGTLRTHLSEYSPKALREIAHTSGVPAGHSKAETINNLIGQGKAEARGAKAPSGARTGGTRTSGAKPVLTPLPGTVGARFDPHQSPAESARGLVRLYGMSQMRTALTGYSHDFLREAATGLGTTPGASKSVTITKILKALRA